MGEVVVSSEEELEMRVESETEEEEMGETESETVKNKEKRKKKDKKGGRSSGVVRWERFLKRMNLRVLLVEADDCTRQIIAALLRKCSYRGQYMSFLPFTSARVGLFCLLY
jgi:pseudo-response regulator 5